MARTSRDTHANTHDAHGTQAHRDHPSLRKDHGLSLKRGYGCDLSVSTGCAVLPFLGRNADVLSESHRWNPHADVAELVDALVSGS